MTIPDKKYHISEKKAKKLKETTDLFGLPLKIGDQCIVFQEHGDSFTNVKDTSALHGIIKDITVYPTLVAEVKVEHYKYSEETRNDPSNKAWRDNKETHQYYNTSILGTTILREAAPEYFL